MFFLTCVSVLLAAVCSLILFSTRLRILSHEHIRAGHETRNFGVYFSNGIFWIGFCCWFLFKLFSYDYCMEMIAYVSDRTYVNLIMCRILLTAVPFLLFNGIVCQMCFVFR